MNKDKPTSQDPTPTRDDLPKSSATPPMSPEEEHSRIGELEAQVKELSVLVEVLMDKPTESTTETTEEEPENPDQLELSGGHNAHDLVDGMREGMEHFLGVQKGETLESRIGSIWLPRGAVILFMTVLVLGIRDESIEAVYKVSIGYLVSVSFVLYGLRLIRTPTLFSNALMGTGLATLYFTTYAVFFIPETRLFENTIWAVPSTIAALVFIGFLLFFSKSETTTGIAFILTYYTVVLSLNQEISLFEVTYASMTCTLVALMAMFLQFHHTRMIVSWISVVATYSTYTYFFVYDPPYLDFQGNDFQRYSVAFLTLIFLAYSIACIGHLRKCEPDSKNLLYFGGINFGAYFFLTWYLMQDYFPDYQTAYWGTMAALMVLLTIAAQSYGAKNSSIMQLFLCIATILASLALYTVLAIEWVLVGFGLECLTLALVYRRFPFTVLKTLHVFLLATIFAGSMAILNLAETVIIEDYAIPVKWISSLSVVTLFTLIAWYYDNRIATHPQTLYHQESHWFLANRRWNWSPSVMAVVNTTAGALILTAMTIVDLANDPRLPFILAAEGLAFALTGILLRTPQMQLSSVLILASTHVSFHFFWMTDKDGFMTQSYFVELSTTLALISFLASYFWERYLRRIEEGTPWEHGLLSSIPFVAATLILTTLFERVNSTELASLGQTALGLILMAVGTYSLLMGLRIAAITALAIGCLNFYIRALDIFAPNTDHPQFVGILIALILCIAFSERLLNQWERRMQNLSRLTQSFHLLLVTVTVLFGILGLWHWAEPENFSLNLMALGVGLLVFGVVFRSARFRFGALFTIFCVFVRLYLYDLSNLAPVLKLVVFATVTLTIFLISWGYSRRRIQKTAD